jgi:hypothetical protein
MQRTLLAVMFAAALAVALTTATPTPAQAYGLAGVGFSGGFADPEDLDGALVIGGHLEFEERGSRLHLQPNLRYWSSGRVSDVNPNFDIYYHFGPAGSAAPFLGAGFGLHFLRIDRPRFRDANETNAGLNLLGGVIFPGRSASFFLEGRLALTELDTTSIVGGVTFRTGH